MQPQRKRTPDTATGFELHILLTVSLHLSRSQFPPSLSGEGNNTACHTRLMQALNWQYTRRAQTGRMPLGQGAPLQFPGLLLLGAK